MDSIPITRAAHALHHETEFKDAVKKIETAIQNALVSDKKYNDVGVISLRWENDDLNLGQVEGELLDLFKKVFHYKTESFIIPATSSQAAGIALGRKLIEFISKYENASSLVIVLYEGHSNYIVHGSAQQLVLFGSSNPAAPVIPWSIVEAQMLTEGDTLAILDSCFSSAAVMIGSNTEYLVASGFESPAFAVIHKSFTRRFIELLQSQINPVVTVAQIHAKLVKQASQPASGLDNTPVHIASENKPSITLHPLYDLPREVASPNKGDELADGKILVSVLLEGKTSVLSVREWESWLASAIPEKVADIKIEAVFETGSILCLVTMPIAVYDMLKGHHPEGAYGFVAYVDSNNIMNTDGFRAEALGLISAHHGNIEIPRREPK